MEKSNQIHESIKTYVIENTYKDSSNLTFDTMLFVEGIVDSMGFALLLDFLEQTFQISPDDSDLVESNFESINAITEYILKKQTVEV